MVTINPHTTRATGTVLTATIYNADHQNHVTNATTIDATAAYKNVANTFTTAQTATELIISTTNGVHRNTTNSLIVFAGGNSLSDGANIELYGSTHATDANDAYFDANTINFRTAAGGSGTAITVNGDLTVTGTLTGAAAAFPSGTVMLFQQTAAPTGWTKLTTHNNKALRLQTGTVTTGGSVAFTTAFASQAVTGTNANATQTGTIGNTTATGTVGGTALTVANLPVHDHSFSATTSSDGDHTHATKTGAPNGGNNLAEASGNNNYASEGHIQNAGAHTHTVSGTTGAAGSGTTHTHSFTGTAHNHTFTGDAHTHTFTGNAINLAVQFVDVILASKD